MGQMRAAGVGWRESRAAPRALRRGQVGGGRLAMWPRGGREEERGEGGGQPFSTIYDKRTEQMLNTNTNTVSD